jgi:hypothetical protein
MLIKVKCPLFAGSGCKQLKYPVAVAVTVFSFCGMVLSQSGFFKGSEAGLDDEQPPIKNYASWRD